MTNVANNIIFKILDSKSNTYEGLTFLHQVDYSFSPSLGQFQNGKILASFKGNEVTSDFHTYGHQNGKEWQEKPYTRQLKLLKGPVIINKLEDTDYLYISSIDKLNSLFEKVSKKEEIIRGCYWSFCKCFIQMRDVIQSNHERSTTLYYLDMWTLPASKIIEDHYHNFHYEVIMIMPEAQRITHFNIGSD